MRKWFVVLAVVALSGMESTVRLMATPLNSKEIPAHAQVVVYVNFDVMRQSPAWMQFCNTLEQRQSRVAARIDRARAAAREALGIRSFNKIHDMTIFFSNHSRKSIVVLLHASFKPTTLMAAIRPLPDFTQRYYGSHHIWSFNKNSHRTIYLARHGRSMLLIGYRLQSVENEIDLFDGKASGLTGHAELLAGSTPGEMFYMAGVGINKLAFVKSPVLRQIDDCWMRVSQGARSMVIQLQARAVNASAALRIASVLKGIKSQIELAGQNTDQHLAVARAAAVASMVLDVKGPTVHVDWAIPNSLLTKLIPSEAAGSASP